MGVLEDNVPQLFGNVDQDWVPDAVVRFVDGGVAQFSRVRFLSDDRLLAELVCPVYAPTSGGSESRKEVGSVVERAYYAAGVWESVAPVPVGVLVVKVDQGKPEVVAGGVGLDRRAANKVAREWIAARAEQEKKRSGGRCQSLVSPDVRPDGDVIGTGYREWRVGPDAYNGREVVSSFEFTLLLPDDHDKPLRERAMLEAQRSQVRWGSDL
ncbi:hypothetical protein [Mycolicibacterium aubagnense]|uniref:Uncharacterized protein n=1 Tax=Mycolicibacterium aubagnense TaxID=319707 RepID=A0ABM7INF2_9MYCO|nr:hypothetical protein [Mycolicibacterium aubagnense]TLH49072.1 hypothetical protein C1S80_29070 [Mycolicibacterium aubagnense]BBX88235.1 hypothetical protein MAUB_64360 [Mycolicibacterium aubagnense]